MDHRKITITGVLVPDNWLENGEISGLALLTNDENKYTIHPSDIKEELMPMLRHKIEISGLSMPDTEPKTIMVTGFRLLTS